MCPLNWEQILKMDMTQLCYKDKNGPPFHRIWRGKSPKCLFLREKITNWFGVCFRVNLYSCPGLFPMPHQSTNGRMSAGMLKRVTSLVLLLSLMHLNATTLWPCLGKLWCTELLRQREMDIKLFIWTGLYSFISWRMVGYMLVDTDGWQQSSRPCQWLTQGEWPQIHFQRFKRERFLLHSHKKTMRFFNKESFYWCCN